MKRMIWLTALLICCTVFLGATSGLCTVWFVKTTAAGNQDGTTWGDALGTIGAAITAASAGDEIWVAEGIYNEHILVNKTLSIYGGFEGDEANLTERDWNLHPTVIDGQDAVMNEGSVVKIPSGVSSVRIDGFTITGGVGTCDSGSRYGGGIYCLGDNAVITNNIITDNHCEDTTQYACNVGGGIYCWGNTATISNNVVSYNTCRSNTAQYASAICAGLECYASPSYNPSTVTGNTIVGNELTGDAPSYCMVGGMRALGSVDVMYNTVTDNVSLSIAGGIYANSGWMGAAGNVIVRGNIVKNNVAATGGGGMMCYSVGAGSMLIASNVIQNNVCASGYGGGIFSDLYGSTPYIVNNTITGNQTSAYGGGMSCNTAVVTNNIIA